ncbi:MAG: hypothetical protein ACI84C_002727 [Flavobacteriales bacterium]|jgi:hypothetical protein
MRLNMQLGTGNYDALFSLNYMVFLSQIGLYNQNMCRWNGANLNDYTFCSVFRDQLALVAQLPAEN